MARFSLDDYEPVESRLRRFWKEHPDGAIHVDNITTEGDRSRGEWVCTAAVYFHHEDIRPRGTDTAFEKDGGTGPQAFASLEVCATSSIGRALANCGYSGNKRASREEMEKVNRGNVTALPIQKPTIDPQTATNIDELNKMWADAVATGQSAQLQTAFALRKVALGD
jgi:hypothetical protein